MDRLDELRVLVAVIDEGGMAAAARRLGKSPPAVTRALTDLEARVGAQLVQRTTRRLAPSEAGLTFAEQARTIIADYETALARAAKQPVRGVLRVTAPVQFGRRHIAPIIWRFLDAYPEIQVEFLLSDRNMDLVDESLDVAVRIGQLADSTLLSQRVGEVRRIVVASPKYLAAHGAPRTPNDLTGHEVIVGRRGGGPTEWRFGAGRRQSATRLNPRLMVDDIETLLAAVRAGRGLGRLLSYQAYDELAAGKLVRILRAYEPPAWPVHLLAQGSKHVAAKTRAFLDFASPALRANRVLASEAKT